MEITTIISTRKQEPFHTCGTRQDIPREVMSLQLLCAFASIHLPSLVKKSEKDSMLGILEHVRDSG